MGVPASPSGGPGAIEDPAGYEPATSDTWPGTNLAGTAMMTKLERNNEEKTNDEEQDEAALYP